MSIHGGRPSTASVDRDGNRTVIPGGKVHHVAAPSRGMEAADHGTKPHCLDKPPKAKGYPIAEAWGQHHVDESGTLQTGISRTESAAALRGGKLPTDPPTVGKVFPVPGVTRGLEAHSNDVERGYFDPENANKVWTEGLEHAGPDHPHRLGATKLPPETTEST